MSIVSFALSGKFDVFFHQYSILNSDSYSLKLSADKNLQILTFKNVYGKSADEYFSFFLSKFWGKIVVLKRDSWGFVMCLQLFVVFFPNFAIIQASKS